MVHGTNNKSFAKLGRRLGLVDSSGGRGTEEPSLINPGCEDELEVKHFPDFVKICFDE